MCVQQIARVDLSLPEEEAAKKVREACMNEGFFYIVNHGVPADLLARMFEINKAFFALPLEEKRKILVNKAFK
jgi:isopenicillin N synthase-like dioxygenase